MPLHGGKRGKGGRQDTQSSARIGDDTAHLAKERAMKKPTIRMAAVIWTAKLSPRIPESRRHSGLGSKPGGRGMAPPPQSFRSMAWPAGETRRDGPDKVRRCEAGRGTTGASLSRGSSSSPGRSRAAVILHQALLGVGGFGLHGCWGAAVAAAACSWDEPQLLLLFGCQSSKG